MINIIKKFLLPSKLIGFFIFNIGFGLLIYVFSNHLEDTPIAYVSYFLSSYALIIFSIWFYKVCKFGNESMKRSKVYSLYQKNILLVTKASMYFSSVWNLLYGILKLGIGVYYRSWWFITFAIYYLLLCFMQVTLAKNISNHEKGYIKLRHTGIIMLLLNFVFMGIIILIISHNQIIRYNGFVIYLIALYDFYLITLAVINVVKYRKNYSPIIMASKYISLTVAMISMVSLEVAMVYQFGNNDSNFKMIMTASMGVVICIINAIIAIYMIINANKNLKLKD